MCSFITDTPPVDNLKLLFSMDYFKHARLHRCGPETFNRKATVVEQHYMLVCAILTDLGEQLLRQEVPFVVLTLSAHLNK